MHPATPASRGSAPGRGRRSGGPGASRSRWPSRSDVELPRDSPGRRAILHVAELPDTGAEEAARSIAIALGTEPSRQRSDGAPEEIDDPDGDQDRPPAGQVPGSGVALRSFADGLGGQGG